MKIEHRPLEERFVAIMNGTEAELTYRETAPGIRNFNHTWVPPELRGHGIGARLVKFGLQHARENGYKVHPGCSFVARYMERFPHEAPP